VLGVRDVSKLRALEKVTTRPPAHVAGPRLPRQSGTERRARLLDGRCPIHGRVFDLQHHESIGTVVGTCTRGGCGVFAVVEDGVWKLPPAAQHLVEDNYLDDAEALMTLARCLSRAERRASETLRETVAQELSLYASAWLAEASDGRPSEA